MTDITQVHDPFLLGSGEGTSYIKIKRKDWELVEAVMRATEGIPHAEINPLSSNSVVAWEAMDKVVELWKRFYPEEAAEFWDRRIAKAKLSGSGATKDQSMRLLVSAPIRLITVIRKVFAGQSFSGDGGKKFWYKFAQRYPEIRATETV